LRFNHIGVFILYENIIKHQYPLRLNKNTFPLFIFLV